MEGVGSPWGSQEPVRQGRARVAGGDGAGCKAVGMGFEAVEGVVERRVCRWMAIFLST